MFGGSGQRVGALAATKKQITELSLPSCPLRDTEPDLLKRQRINKTEVMF